MRVSWLEVESYKGIRAVAFAPAEGVTEISGPNGAGKSSTLEAIAVWLDGLAAAPAEPIRKGAERTKIRGRLGEMYVTRYIERKKGGGHTTKIMFENIEGKPYPGTQKQLTDLIGEHHLDPLDFLALDKKGKFDALKVFVPGFDFDRAKRDHESDYARRTEVKAVAQKARAAAALISVPDGTPTQPIDEQALVRELQEAGDLNAETERRRANRQRVEEAVTQRRQFAEGVSKRIDGLEHSERDICRRETERIQQQITALQAQMEQLQKDRDTKIATETVRLQREAQEAADKAAADQKRLDEADPLPEAKDTVALSIRIEQARRTNQAVMRAVERAKHERTAAQYEAESEALTQSIKAREMAKQEAIAGAKLPIAGIDFGEGEILLHGVPFDQASTAQKLRAAVAYIVARNPKLRLAWVKDASLLDDASYAEIHRLAREYNVDIYLETVRAIGRDAIVLEDGRIKEDAAAPKQAQAVSA